MRVFITRNLIKGAVVLLGILVISAGLQFVIWDGIAEFARMAISIDLPDEGSYKQWEIYLREKLGGEYFIPDLWPFDNESMWHE